MMRVPIRYMAIGLVAAAGSTAISGIIDRVAAERPMARDHVRHSVSLLQAITGASLLLPGNGAHSAAGLGVLAGIYLKRFVNGIDDPKTNERVSLPARTAPVSESEVLRTARATVDDARRAFEALGLSAADGNTLEGLQFKYAPENRNNAHYNNNTIIIGATDTGRPFSDAPDIMVHEYVHSILEKHGVGVWGQAGGVTESLCDTLAAVIDGNWTHGEDIYLGGGRDMRSGEGSVSFLQWIIRGAPHVRMGVPNRAAAEIGDHLGRHALGRLYVDAIKHLPDRAKFKDLRSTLLDSAARLWGEDSREVNVVRLAWENAIEHG